MNQTRNILALLAVLLCLPLVVLLGILAVPFFLISLFTDTLNTLLQRRHVPWNAIIEFQENVGWKTKPNLNAFYLAIDHDVCHVETDSQGGIGPSSLAESDIVVFGDSFAFGYGVDAKDAYFNLHSDLKVKAFCSPGYNMVQELLLMRELAPQLAHKFVVWFVCLENDLYENLRPASQHPQHVYPRPFVRRIDGSSNWEIINSHVRPSNAGYQPPLRMYYQETFARLCTPCPYSEQVYSASEFLLQQGLEVCSKVGAKLAVLTIPYKYQMNSAGISKILSKLPPDEKLFDVDFPDKQFARICQQLQIPFVPAKQYLSDSDYKNYDWHWNTRGNRKIAKSLGELYKTYGHHKTPLFKTA